MAQSCSRRSLRLDWRIAFGFGDGVAPTEDANALERGTIHLSGMG